MTVKVEEFEYRFSELVFIGHRARGNQSPVWYIECPECHGKHQFSKTGSKVWTATCFFTDTEWTVTPKEYYVKKVEDFTRILGDA